MTDETEVSSYLDYLPAIFRQDAFLGRFLVAFEEILSGLEGQLDTIDDYFDPATTPAAFLEWLSGWVALSLRADLTVPQRRDFIANAVPLYRLRGTKQGLETLIQIYTGLPSTINEFNTSFQIGVHSTIGVDTLLDGGAPHFFQLTIRLAKPDPEELKPDEPKRIEEVVTAIINMEKPAHAWYELGVITPVLRIGVYSTIGVDTVLGTETPHDNSIEEETS
jgi:phage tail-like protein